MTHPKWTVDVDGTQYEISAQTDGATGRTSIRVNGRMASRPLAPEEEERSIAVGSAIYLLRRLPDGTFDLELDPEAQLAAASARNQQYVIAPKKSKSPVRKFVLLGSLIAVVLAYGSWEWHQARYSRAPWSRWTSPRTNASIDMPATPADHTSIVTDEGEDYEVALYGADYLDHSYAFQHYDMGGLVEEHVAPQLLTEEIRSAWEGTEIESITPARVSGRDAMQFVAHAPAQDGDPPFTARGIATVHRSELFMAWVEAPLRESQTSEVARYLKSLRLPNEYAYKRTGYMRPDTRQRDKAMLAEAHQATRLSRVIARIVISLGVLLYGAYVLRTQFM